MSATRLEVGMRLEAEAAGVVDGAEHQILDQLEWRGLGLLVVAAEELAHELAHLRAIHGARADRVLHAEAMGVDEIPARRDLAVPVLARDQDARDLREHVTIVLIVGELVAPLAMTFPTKARAPGRADPAAHGPQLCRR